jgi:hypothetical protein
VPWVRTGWSCCSRPPSTQPWPLKRMRSINRTLA